MTKMIRYLFVLLFFSYMTSFVALAAPAEFSEGADYAKIIPVQPTSTGDKIEVIELFWYGCPHCYRFQAPIEKWLKTLPDNVEHVRMPAIFNDKWAFHAQAFYTAEALGILEEIHGPFFAAIHNAKNRLDTEPLLIKFFSIYGVSEEDFKKAFHSFAVASKVKRARMMTARYGINSTPSVVINGKYRTDPGMIKGGYDKLLKVMDFLIAKEGGIAK